MIMCNHDKLALLQNKWALFVALHATRLRHEDWKPWQKWLVLIWHNLITGIVLLFVMVIHAACYKVVGWSLSCSQIFFISMFNLGKANGAKVGLKLRLGQWLHTKNSHSFVPRPIHLPFPVSTGVALFFILVTPCTVHHKYLIFSSKVDHYEHIYF